MEAEPRKSSGGRWKMGAGTAGWGPGEPVGIKTPGYGIGEVETFMYMFGMWISAHSTELNTKEGNYLFLRRSDLGRGLAVNPGGTTLMPLRNQA